MTNRFSYCPFIASASGRDPDEERPEEAQTSETVYIKKKEEPEA